jgi:putative hydrolase of the HAD superfamily
VKDVKAIVFDMGGTLIEFERAPWNLLQIMEVNEIYAFLTKRNGKMPSLKLFREVYRERWAEARDKSITRHKELDLAGFLKSLCSGVGMETDDELVEALLQVHYAPVRRELTLYPDSIATLEALRARGFKIGLLSNTMWPREFHEADLDKFGLSHLFDTKFFSSDFPWRKPHPAIFLAALEALDVTPENAAYVGDFPERDVVGAKAAGMTAILKYHPLRELSSTIVPDVSIRDVADLLDLLS